MPTANLKKLTLPPPPPPNQEKCQIFKFRDQNKKKSVRLSDFSAGAIFKFSGAKYFGPDFKTPLEKILPTPLRTR